MEIKIDTAKDSKEEIRRVIQFLQQFLDENLTSNISAPAASQGSSGGDLLGGFFDMSSSPEPASQPGPTEAAVQERPSQEQAPTMTLAQMFAADSAAQKKEEPQEPTESTGLFLDLGGNKFIPLEQAEPENKEKKSKKKFTAEDFDTYGGI